MNTSQPKEPSSHIAMVILFSLFGILGSIFFWSGCDDLTTIPSSAPIATLLELVGIAATIACLVFRIIGIVKGSNVSRLHYLGKYDEAFNASDTARKCGLLTGIIGLIMFVAFLSLTFFFKTETDILLNNP